MSGVFRRPAAISTIAGLLIASIISSGCYTKVATSPNTDPTGPTGNQPSVSPKQDFQDARRKWSAVGLKRYSYRMGTAGPWIGYSVTAEVIDGQVRSIHDFISEGPDSANPMTAPTTMWTVEEMFEAIEQDGNYRAGYDADDGHPTSFVIGRPEVDAGFHHRVLWLRPANIK